MGLDEGVEFEHDAGPGFDGEFGPGLEGGFGGGYSGFYVGLGGDCDGCNGLRGAGREDGEVLFD